MINSTAVSCYRDPALLIVSLTRGRDPVLVCKDLSHPSVYSAGEIPVSTQFDYEFCQLVEFFFSLTFFTQGHFQ
jgi:hypothetical protein